MANLFVPLDELRQLQAVINRAIESAEARGLVQQYQQAVGYLTGKTCQHCGKTILDPNPQEATRIGAIPESQASWAHEHCQEIQTLRGALGEAEKRPHITLVELPKMKSQEEDPDHAPNPEEVANASA